MNNSIKLLLIISAAIAVTITTTHSAYAISASDMVQLTGEAAQDNVGYRIASGDLNNDGYDEVIIGAPFAQTNGSENGAVYIVYGGDDLIADQSLSASNVVKYYGEGEYDWAGISIAGNGDINADGYDDLLIGALQNPADDYYGAVYVLYGGPDQLSGGDLVNAVKLSGTVVNEFAGYTINYIGDVNGDGYDDIGAGVQFYDSGSNNIGEVYVIYGQADQFTNSTLLNVGIRITGQNANNYFGSSVSRAGDLNADGYDDWLVGAYGYNGGAASSGTIYVMYGQSNDYETGVILEPQLQGEALNDQIGYLTAPAGDLNNDGYDDAIIGSSFSNNGADDNTGATYIFYGSATEITTQSISSLPKFTGETAEDYFSNGIAGVGTVSSDGYPDFALSSPYNDTVAENSGRVYLVDGQSSAFDSADITSVTTTTIDGVSATELFGYMLTWADVNGDGFSELISGAPFEDTVGNDAGAVYIGYLRIDKDQDGALGAGGLLESDTDCDDTNSLVQTNQTYYVDQDDDGLGVNTNPISVCTNNAPEGYASNTDDTDDSIANNGIEIDDDGIDNDGDGDVDENNSLDDNGEHPGFGSLDPTDSDSVTAAINQVTPRSNGRIQVRFADNSVFVYRVFSGSSVGKPKIKKYPGTGYYAAMLPTGKKIALVNILNGNIIARKKIRSTVYKKHYMQFTDFRSNDVQDLVVTSKRGDTVRLIVTEANFQAGKFKYLNTVEVTSPEAIIKNTSIVNNTIDIRSRLAALQSIFVNKKHHLDILN